MFDFLSDKPNYMGAAMKGSLSLSGNNETDPTKEMASRADLKTGKIEGQENLGEKAIAKDLAENNEAGILSKGSSIDSAVDQELEDQATAERNSQIANGLGIIALTASTAAAVADSAERNKPRVRQSNVRASAQRGGGGSNLLSGGVERYLRPIGGRGTKIQGYFR